MLTVKPENKYLGQNQRHRNIFIEGNGQPYIIFVVEIIVVIIDLICCGYLH